MTLEEEKLIQAADTVEIKIKKRMLEKGFTQIELAKLLGVNRSTISTAISGSISPKSKETRLKIYKILGMGGE